MKIGNKIAVLDYNIEGRVININSEFVTIESEDGFILQFNSNEIIVIDEENQLNYDLNRNSLLNQKSEQKTTYNVNKKSKNSKVAVPEFDLHIEKLVNNHKHMNNYDILNYQLETARRHIEFAIKNRIPKIVLIHGVGEGVLKTELEYLFRKYDGMNYQEASYQRYGVGATELYFKQNK